MKAHSQWQISLTPRAALYFRHPEPTDYQHFEIYTYNLGTATRSVTVGQSGIDFNYGAAPDLQLTATLLEGFDRPVGGGTDIAWGNVQLAAKNADVRLALIK